MSVKLSSWRLKQKTLQKQNAEEKQQHATGPTSFSVHVEKVETENSTDESVSKPSSMMETSKIVNQLGRLKRFITRKRPKQTHMVVSVFSLHGYSSLKMQQDGPKACANKVSLPAVYIWTRSYLNVIFADFRLCASLGWQFVSNFWPWRRLSFTTKMLDWNYHFSSYIMYGRPIAGGSARFFLFDQHYNIRPLRVWLIQSNRSMPSF